RGRGGGAGVACSGAARARAEHPGGLHPRGGGPHGAGRGRVRAGDRGERGGERGADPALRRAGRRDGHAGLRAVACGGAPRGAARAGRGARGALAAGRRRGDAAVRGGRGAGGRVAWPGRGRLHSGDMRAVRGDARADTGGGSGAGGSAGGAAAARARGGDAIMRVLYVSKALVVAAYRDKLRELAAHVDVTALVPERWGAQAPERDADAASAPPVITRPALLHGHNHFHVYRGAGALLDALRPDLVHIDEEPYSIVTLQFAELCRARGIPTLFFAAQNLVKRLPPPFGALRARVFRTVSGGIGGTPAASRALRAVGY